MWISAVSSSELFVYMNIGLWIASFESRLFSLYVPTSSVAMGTMNKGRILILILILIIVIIIIIITGHISDLFSCGLEKH